MLNKYLLLFLLLTYYIIFKKMSKTGGSTGPILYDVLANLDS